jgi:hypothetical protein
VLSGAAVAWPFAARAQRYAGRTVAAADINDSAESREVIGRDHCLRHPARKRATGGSTVNSPGSFPDIGGDPPGLVAGERLGATPAALRQPAKSEAPNGQGGSMGTSPVMAPGGRSAET